MATRDDCDDTKEQDPIVDEKQMEIDKDLKEMSTELGKKVRKNLMSVLFVVSAICVGTTIYFGTKGLLLNIYRLYAGQKSPPPSIIDRNNEIYANVKKTDAVVSADGDGEYFSSIVNMKRLVIIEQQVIQAMANMVQFDEDKIKLSSSRVGLKKIKRYINDYDNSLRPMLLKTEINPGVFFKWPLVLSPKDKSYKKDVQIMQIIVVSHPVISYRMLRRISVDLQEILRYTSSQELHKMWTSIDPRVGRTDVRGAIEGIFRLQTTFLMTPQDFAEGRLMNTETKSGLTAMDCHLIGKTALQEENFVVAVEWIFHALKMVLKGSNNFKAEVITHLSEIRMDLLKATKQHNTAFDSNVLSTTFSTKIYEKVVLWDGKTNAVDEQFLPNRRSISSPVLFTEGFSSIDQNNFYYLCRGEEIRSPSLTKNLDCYYINDHPSLLIKPVKAELHNEVPLIVQLYDVIPHTLIQRVKKVSIGGMQRAKVVGKAVDKDSTVSSKLRISSNAWINEKQDEILKVMPKMIEDFTGLNLKPIEASEDAQVAAYGAIGGYYNIHWDNLFDKEYASFRNLSEEQLSQGDRIATVMFYLSDVQLGGGTAFPKLGVVSQPIKGSAMFWFNMKENGEKNQETLHGGCPVLFGEKWVLNKWIRAGDQFLKRKCGLDPKV